MSKSNQLVFRDYPGEKIPNLDPRTILITRDGAIEIILKTRKRISPDVLHILKAFNIDTTNKKCLTKEQQTLSSITNAFKTENFEDQFKVDMYYLDLYFPDYKLVIECDENGHSDRKPYNERGRMDYVNKKFNIDDTNWIRYNPDEYDFDISKVIGKIYRKIDEIKDGKYKKQSNENEVLKLQIEPITGKFLAPSKEFLIEKLKTHCVTDIARMFNISPNPVTRWIKLYNIDIKKTKAKIEPTKEELIEQFIDKNQIEVSMYYNVSVHIVRRWLTKYNLDMKNLQQKTILKKDLLNLVNDFSEEEIAKKLNITMLSLQKNMKIHSIEKIPNKNELQNHINNKTKDEIAKIYNVNRATLRKWINSYDLDAIRYCSFGRPITATKNNIIKKYRTIADLCKDLHIGHNKVDEYVDSGETYNDYIFEFVEKI